MSTTAVMILRKGSKRIHLKNYQLLGFKPMYLHKLEQLTKLRQQGRIDQVVVGSDDPELEKIVTDHGAKFCMREPEFCDEESATVNEVVKNMLTFFKSDLVLWAHCTNPFIDEDDYATALGKYDFFARIGHDSLFSVNRLKGHFWTKDNPINFKHGSPTHQVASEADPIYEQNGGLFIRPYDDMVKDGAFIGRFPMHFVMNPYKGFDINTGYDLEIARALYGKHGKL